MSELRKEVLQSSAKDWSLLLPWTQLLINTRTSSVTQASPYTLLFGSEYPARNQVEALLLKKSSAKPSPDTSSQALLAIFERNRALNRIRKKARDAQGVYIDKRKHQRPKQLFQFDVNDLVLRKNAGQTKLHKHLGPYIISHKLSDSTFIIKSLVTNQQFTVSSYELLPFLP
ncbi:hypothetical protein GEMRC1_005015 [Eukaryota sp. GEM-RC1]